MNLKRQVKLAIVFALMSQDNFVQESQQARIAEKDFSLTGLFSKMSNLEAIALDKRQSGVERSPENMEMLQLTKSENDIQLNGKDVNDIMVASNIQVVGRDSDSSDSQPAPEEDDMMTITEQMEHVRTQTSKALKQIKVDQENDKKKKAIQDKKDKERKEKEKQDAARKKRLTKKTDDQEMDEFVELQLQKQKADREQYDEEHKVEKPEEQTTDVDSKVTNIISNSKKPGDTDEASSEEHKTGFNNADDAIEHFGSAIAQRSVEGQIKKAEEKKEEAAKKIREQNAEKIAQEKKEREEAEQKKKEEEEEKAEEQKKYDERKNRLLSKLQSLQGDI